MEHGSFDLTIAFARGPVVGPCLLYFYLPVAGTPDHIFECDTLKSLGQFEHKPLVIQDGKWPNLQH